MREAIINEINNMIFIRNKLELPFHALQREKRVEKRVEAKRKEEKGKKNVPNKFDYLIQYV